MADGKLIFPVKFDLQSAVRQAHGDADRALRQIQVMIDARPLTIHPKIDDAALRGISEKLGSLSIPTVNVGRGRNAFTAAEGSINALSAAMQKCIREWNNLSESERIVNRESGEYTSKAQQIITRFAELTAASNTYAKSLQQIARESKTAADAEIKRNQKAAEQVAVLGNQERTLDQVNSKIRLLTQIMSGIEKSDPQWKTLAANLERVRQKQAEMQAVQKAELAQLQGEYNAVKQLITALQGYGNTIGQIQTKLSAFKSALNGATVGGAAFREAALQMKAMNEELQRANQLAQNYQAKSLQGVGKKNTNAAVRDMEQYQQRIREIDAQMNLAHAKGQDMGSQQMIKLLQERIALEEKLKNIMTTGADAAKAKLDAEIAAQQKLIEETSRRAEAYNKKRQQEAEDLAAQQRKAAEESRIKQESIAKEQQTNEARKRILNEQRLSYDTLVQKIQMLETARNRTDIGAARWTRLTAEINKAKESLKVITDEMDKVSRRSERIARLREIMAMSAQSMQGLSARLQEANAALQKLDYGTAAFDRLARKIALLSGEYQKAQQYAQLFQEKAFSGVSGWLVQEQVNKVRDLRLEIQQIDAQLNAHRQSAISGRGGTMSEQQVNQLLDQRIAKQKEINEITKTAAQQQAEREREINKIIESRHAKQKAHSDAVRQTVQARKQERTMLMASEKTVDNITKKLQHWQTKLNSTNIGSAEFTKIAAEVERLTRKLEEARRKIAELTGQTQSGASRQASALGQVSHELRNQETYVSRLIKRMAVYASFSAAGNFLQQIREVTAQFELQRVSLGAILQDQAKAEVLFTQIKGLALESPISVLDLTKYTKQLAAYKIGYDELFETTKRLTDVSVGLGVSMDRIILAYGQIRAAGVLRASEVRQLTEAGIPIVEELAKKLSDANGQLVKASDVMDMISKREIPFEMVADVFEDMTSKGGIFYNMQEKQADTLYGLWQKLGDAASIMYAEIGNIGPINSGMKTLIEVLRSMMKHWNVTAAAIMAVAGAMVKMKIASMSAALTTAHQTAAHAAHVGALKMDVAAREAYCHTVTKSSFLTKLNAQAQLAAARANLAAAQSNNVLTASLYKAKAAMLSNPYTAIIAAVAVLGTVLYEAWTSAHELDNKLEEIDDKYAELSRTAPKNFEKLADAAVKAADGSKKQKDALDELKRTYGEMLPAEALQIENLRALGGAYEMLTNQVKAYYEQQRHEERVAAIKENWAAVMREEKKEIKKRLEHDGASEKQIAVIMDYIDAAFISGEDLEEALMEGIEEAGLKKTDFKTMLRGAWNRTPIGAVLRGDWGQAFAGWTTVEQTYDKFAGNKMTDGLAEAQNDLANALEMEDERFQETMDTLNEYHSMVEDIVEQNAKLQNIDFGPSEGFFGFIDNIRDKLSGVFPFSLFKNGFKIDPKDWNLTDALDSSNAQIQNMGERIKEELEKAGITVQEGWFEFGRSVKDGGVMHGFINFPAIIEAAVKAGKTDLATAIKELQPVYQQIAPPDETTRGLWAKVQQIGRVYKLSAADIRSYSIKAGESLSQYRKRLETEEESIADSMAKLARDMVFLKLFGKSTEASEKALAELKEKAAAIKEILGAVGRTPTKGGGRGSDQRLQQLQEMFRTLKAINKEYDDLAQKEGKSKAGAWVTENYEATLRRLNKLAQKFNLSFGFPLTPESLQKYGKEIIDKINSLNLKGGDKAIIDLQLELAKDSQTRLEKDIEQQLKAISDRISRTKTAKEFYEKILSQTGNREMAASLASAIFGENGDALNREMAARARQMVAKTSVSLPDTVFNADMSLNTKSLRAWVEINKKELGGVADELKKLADESEKDTAKMVEGWMKATEKAKTYGDKLAEIYRRTATETARIDNEVANGNIGRAQGKSLKEGFRRKEAEDVAKLQYEAFKDSPMYVQMFEDLDHASTRMLKNMKSRLEGMQSAWRNLDPTQLKEMQSRLKEIDAQLAKRNPFKVMANGLREYHKLRTKGDSRGNRSRKAADEDAIRWAEAQKKAEEELAKIKNDPNATQAQLAGAAAMVDTTKREADEAAKAAANWKKVEDAIGLSGKELLSMLNWAGDTARAVADISEAMGADENDVQYWNDIADALSEISGGIQDIISAAMSGNVMGVVSSALTAVPKMFVGFVNLFSAGKIKRANKEIKRQQEVLEQLEYTYSRLQDAADRLFGTEYINNYSRQLANLRAQQSAYTKQAEAERSKGKKRDKEKIKDYENQARDTADKIQELYGELAAHFAGQSKTDAAKQMAQSWLEARASLSDTFSAIRGDYSEMIKNMIVEGAAARVIENALSPMWKKMEQSLADNDMDGAIDAMINGMDSALNAANNGMEVLWKALEQRGYDMKQLLADTDADSEHSGIAKNIASATSEEINSVAAIGNTMMYHTSFLPQIYAELVAIRTSSLPDVVTASSPQGWTDWQQQAMANFNAIAQNTANTVSACRRAAAACENATGMLNRVIVQRGSKAAINTTYIQ